MSSLFLVHLACIGSCVFTCVYDNHKSPPSYIDVSGMMASPVYYYVDEEQSLCKLHPDHV